MTVMSAVVHGLGRPLAAVLTAISAIILLTSPDVYGDCGSLNAGSAPSRAPSLSSESTHGFVLHLALPASDSFIALSSTADYSGADLDSTQPDIDSGQTFNSYSARFAVPTVLSKLHRLLFRIAYIPPPHPGV